MGNVTRQLVMSGNEWGHVDSPLAAGLVGLHVLGSGKWLLTCGGLPCSPNVSTESPGSSAHSLLLTWTANDDISCPSSLFSPLPLDLVPALLPGQDADHCLYPTLLLLSWLAQVPPRPQGSIPRPHSSALQGRTLSPKALSFVALRQMITRSHTWL